MGGGVLDDKTFGGTRIVYTSGIHIGISHDRMCGVGMGNHAEDGKWSEHLVGVRVTSVKENQNVFLDVFSSSSVRLFSTLFCESKYIFSANRHNLLEGHGEDQRQRANLVPDCPILPGTVFAAITSDGMTHVYDLSVNRNGPLCLQKVVTKAKCTHVAFNPTSSIVVVGDDRGGVTSLKLSPNLRKAVLVTEEKPKLSKEDQHEAQVSKTICQYV